MRTVSSVLVLASTAAAATVDFTGRYATAIELNANQTVEVYAGIPSPSTLPPNARIAVSWPGFRKVLHAFDPDFFLVFRAPAAGTFQLELTTVEDEEPIFNKPRWRETGTVERLYAFPRKTPWPAGHSVRLRTWIKPVDPGATTRGMILEAEPNDSIVSAQPVAIGSTGSDETFHITGSADDAEYFDNGDIGRSGIDWFRIDYKGSEPRLFTANLGLPDPFVVAQLLFYTADGTEYREGANPNERAHQQTEGHRTAMNRLLKPGGVYFLKVEANSPGYEVELRIRKPAPYTDASQAVRQAMYDQLGQVDAWLLNRPRGAAVDRRIRDTGSLLGSHCMSCHTQSGVWGPLGAMLKGYRPENVVNLRHLRNLAYESMRPTNTLAEAANNTSLAPLDLGDGPAGTRVAGYNVTLLEGLIPARRLHSAQQIRAANFVLQSADPAGINAAGPGSNIGQALVYRFAGEILMRAWRTTRNPKYVDAVEEKARRMLAVNPRFCDDISNRILFFREVFPSPAEYLALRGETDDTKAFLANIAAQVDEDARRLTAIQRPDGMWQFHPGTREGQAWKLKTDDDDVDPAPTALAITAFHALGVPRDDPRVARAIQAILSRQDPFGRWNKHALTGFVTTAYTLHALARYFPVNDAVPPRAALEPSANESLSDTVARVRAIAQLGFSPEDRRSLPLAIAASGHESPLVRYWAQGALGGLHDERGIQHQIGGLADPVKMVREAARWGLRQTLLDDKGWDHLFPALASAGDLTREWAAGALVMRADTVMTHSGAGWKRITAALSRLMLEDRHPAARAWAMRAAWNWWVWNPPVREDLNRAFLAALENEEPSVLAENARRYQTEALFIANGQRANGSKEHQYPELTRLFEAIDARLQSNPPPLLARRLTAVAATFYNQAGGDGGPGQMGYVTPGSSDALGKAVLAYWNATTDASKDPTRLALEAAANITYEPLQKRLLAYSTGGPEEFRTLAATSLADPRVITLNAAQEFVEPLMEQVLRGAAEPERRVELVNPILKLFARARWNLPKSAEQQKIFYRLLVPGFPEERAQLPENLRQPLQMEKDSTDWYLARSMARVLHSNPDLHTPALLDTIPAKLRSPMEEMLWVESARWLLEWETPVPEVGKAMRLDDRYGPRREWAAELVARQITGNVDRRLRAAAVSLAASDAAVRNHETVRRVLEPVEPKLYEKDAPEAAALASQWRKNFEYFRDHVVPELQRPNRDDETACMTCHGLAGRVPSMELKPAANNGYMSAAAVWANYRMLLDRVDDADGVENSKLLRKPLNVQSGKEDGHQGGRRYNPGDRGYQIIRRWVLDAAALKSTTPL
jgi:HEAT repeat protein